MNSSRQLAAIMFTHIVGYTELIQEDKTVPLQLLQKLKKKLKEEVTQKLLKNMPLKQQPYLQCGSGY